MGEWRMALVSAVLLCAVAPGFVHAAEFEVRLPPAKHPRAATVDELAELAHGYGWRVSRLVPV
ncbi:MAG: hypothetical protein QHJ73_14355, partial [Armatimonadota bacterium]|nr:hypothetical protein [Armatimonadota bacterium]